MTDPRPSERKELRRSHFPSAARSALTNRVPSWWLGLVVWGLVGAGARAQTTVPSGPFSADERAWLPQVAALLKGPSPRANLLGLPPAAAPAMVSVLWSDPGTTESGAEHPRGILLDVLGRRAEPVTTWVARISRDGTTTPLERIRTVQILGELRAKALLNAVLILLDTTPSRVHRAPMFVLQARRTLRLTIDGDADQLRVLAKRWNRLKVRTRALLAREAPNFGLRYRDVVGFLAKRSGPPESLLKALSALLPRVGVFEPTTIAAIREHYRNGDSAVRCRAAILLGQCGDSASIPDLLRMLDSPLRPERRAALEGLRTLSGKPLPLVSRRWRRWYAEEELWYAEFAPAALTALESRDVEQVVRALAQVREHRVYAKDFAPALRDLLESPSPLLRRLSCQSLMHLAMPEVRHHLVRALDDSDQGVRELAHEALRRTTKLDLPPNSRAWQQELLADR